MSEFIQTIPLSYYADIVMGQSPNSTAVSTTEIGVPFLQGCAEFGRKAPKSKFHCFPPLRVAHAGSVLISVRAPVGKVNWADQNYCIGRGLGAVKAKADKSDTHFLHYALEENVTYLHSVSQGSTFSAIGGQDLKNFPVPKFELYLQKKIATILQTIDDAIENTEALIEKYEQIKVGMMHDLFTRGLMPDGQLRPSREKAPELYKETPIGWIPKEWEYELLDKLADRKSGHTPSKSFPEYWNGGIKWVSLADSYRLDNLYIDDTDYEISALGIQNSSAVLLPAGVVVMSRDAGVGKSAIATQSMAVSQHFMAWHCTTRMNNYFLYYWLQFNKRTFQNIAMGSTILTIGLSYFKRLKISAPQDIEEQKAIGKRLKEADIFLFTLDANLKKLRTLKTGLMHDLLTGKVKVKIDKTEAANV